MTAGAAPQKADAPPGPQYVPGDGAAGASTLYLHGSAVGVAPAGDRAAKAADCALLEEFAAVADQVPSRTHQPARF